MIESSEEFIRICRSGDPEVNRRANVDSASLEVWVEVVEQHPEARVWVALNKSVPLEILKVLATDPDPRVRFTVAAKRKLTPEILAQLAADHDESIRLSVARHRNTPRSVLEELQSDDWSAVRELAGDRVRNDSLG